MISTSALDGTDVPTNPVIGVTVDPLQPARSCERTVGSGDVRCLRSRAR